MNSIDQNPSEGSPESIVDTLRIFLSTHPLPQGVIRFLHNIGL